MLGRTQLAQTYLWLPHLCQNCHLCTKTKIFHTILHRTVHQAVIQIFRKVKGIDRTSFNCAKIRDFCLFHNNYSCQTPTKQNSFYKWNKILALKVTTFVLKIVIESGLEVFFFEIIRAPLELRQKNLPGKAELAWQLSLKGLFQFQNKKKIKSTFHQQF